MSRPLDVLKRCSPTSREDKSRCVLDRLILSLDDVIVALVEVEAIIVSLLRTAAELLTVRLRTGGKYDEFVGVETLFIMPLLLLVDE